MNLNVVSLRRTACPPTKVTVVLDDAADVSKLPLLLPMDAAITLKKPTDDYPLKDGKTTFYICRGHSCLPPTNDPVMYDLMDSRET